MRRIVIASHYGLAAGLRSTLEGVGANACDIVDVCAYRDDRPLEDLLAEAFARAEDGVEVLVLTDILQGSVNQAVVRTMPAGCLLVTGVNLPCALELALYAGALTDETVDDAVERARAQLRRVTATAGELSEDDE